MTETPINLNEGFFPIPIKKEIKNLDNLDNLGVIKKDIKINLEIEKYSDDLLLAKGDISVTFLSECQKCSKLMDIDLQIKTQVGIKNITEEKVDEKGPYEIHYQDLNCFNIDDLIAEEIHLNFPSVVICCNPDNANDKEDKENQKIRPFKKIRDLIK